MNTFFKFIFVLLSSLLISNCSDESANTLSGDISYEKEIMTLINNYRRENGLKNLETSNFIKELSDNHTAYMLDQGKISHDYWENRTKAIYNKFKSYKCAENVASNSSNKAETVVNQWVNSDEHRKNMLGDFTHFYVSAKQNNGKWYYTNIFVKIP